MIIVRGWSPNKGSALSSSPFHTFSSIFKTSFKGTHYLLKKTNDSMVKAKFIGIRAKGKLPRKIWAPKSPLVLIKSSVQMSLATIFYVVVVFDCVIRCSCSALSDSPLVLCCGKDHQTKRARPVKAVCLHMRSNHIP